MQCKELTQTFTLQNIDMFQVCECSAVHCTRHFALIDDVAFPGYTVRDETTRYYFFCSNECYLRAMPTANCWRA